MYPIDEFRLNITKRYVEDKEFYRNKDLERIKNLRELILRTWNMWPPKGESEIADFIRFLVVERNYGQNVFVSQNAILYISSIFANFVSGYTTFYCDALAYIRDGKIPSLNHLHEDDKYREEAFFWKRVFELSFIIFILFHHRYDKDPVRVGAYRGECINAREKVNPSFLKQYDIQAMEEISDLPSCFYSVLNKIFVR